MTDDKFVRDFWKRLSELCSAYCATMIEPGKAEPMPENVADMNSLVAYSHKANTLLCAYPNHEDEQAAFNQVVSCMPADVFSTWAAGGGERTDVHWTIIRPDPQDDPMKQRGFVGVKWEAANAPEKTA